MINIVARCAALSVALGVLFTLVMLVGRQVHVDQAVARPHAVAAAAASDTATDPAAVQPDGDDQWI
jgi:hypothetical protein